MSFKETAGNLPKAVLAGAVIGGVTTVAIEASARLDRMLNPQIYAALQQSMGWFQVFTTQHARTVLYLEHEPLAAFATFAVTALVGTIATNHLLNK